MKEINIYKCQNFNFRNKKKAFRFSSIYKLPASNNYEYNYKAVAADKYRFQMLNNENKKVNSLEGFYNKCIAFNTSSNGQFMIGLLKKGGCFVYNIITESLRIVNITKYLRNIVLIQLSNADIGFFTGRSKLYSSIHNTSKYKVGIYISDSGSIIGLIAGNLIGIKDGDNKWKICTVGELDECLVIESRFMDYSLPELSSWIIGLKSHPFLPIISLVWVQIENYDGKYFTKISKYSFKYQICMVLIDEKSMNNKSKIAYQRLICKISPKRKNIVIIVNSFDPNQIQIFVMNTCSKRMHTLTSEEFNISAKSWDEEEEFCFISNISFLTENLIIISLSNNQHMIIGLNNEQIKFYFRNKELTNAFRSDINSAFDCRLLLSKPYYFSASTKLLHKRANEKLYLLGLFDGFLLRTYEVNLRTISKLGKIKELSLQEIGLGICRLSATEKLSEVNFELSREIMKYFPEIQKDKIEISNELYVNHLDLIANLATILLSRDPFSEYHHVKYLVWILAHTLLFYQLLNEPMLQAFAINIISKLFSNTSNFKLTYNTEPILNNYYIKHIPIYRMSDNEEINLPIIYTREITMIQPFLKAQFRLIFYLMEEKYVLEREKLTHGKKLKIFKYKKLIHYFLKNILKYLSPDKIENMISDTLTAIKDTKKEDISEEIIKTKPLIHLLELLINNDYDMFCKEFQLNNISIESKEATSNERINIQELGIVTYTFIQIIDCLISNMESTNKKVLKIRIMNSKFAENFKIKIQEWISFDQMRNLYNLFSKTINIPTEQPVSLLEQILDMKCTNKDELIWIKLYLLSYIGDYTQILTFTREINSFECYGFGYELLIESAFDELNIHNYRRETSSEEFKILKDLFLTALQLPKKYILQQFKENKAFIYQYLEASFGFIYLTPRILRGYFREEILFDDLVELFGILKHMSKKIKVGIFRGLRGVGGQNINHRSRKLLVEIYEGFPLLQSFADTETITYLKFLMLRIISFIGEKNGNKPLFHINHVRIADFANNFAKLLKTFENSKDLTDYLYDIIILSNFEVKDTFQKTRNKKSRKFQISQAMKKEILKYLRLVWYVFILSKIQKYKHKYKYLAGQKFRPKLSYAEAIEDQQAVAKCKFLYWILKLRNFPDLIKIQEIYEIIVQGLNILTNFHIIPISIPRLSQNISLYVDDLFEMGQVHRPAVTYILSIIQQNNAKLFEELQKEVLDWQNKLNTDLESAIKSQKGFLGKYLILLMDKDFTKFLKAIEIHYPDIIKQSGQAFTQGSASMKTVVKERVESTGKHIHTTLGINPNFMFRFDRNGWNFLPKIPRFEQTIDILLSKNQILSIINTRQRLHYGDKYGKGIHRLNIRERLKRELLRRKISRLNISEELFEESSFIYQPPEPPDYDFLSLSSSNRESEDILNDDDDDLQFSGEKHEQKKVAYTDREKSNWDIISITDIEDQFIYSERFNMSPPGDRLTHNLEIEMPIISSKIIRLEEAREKVDNKSREMKDQNHSRNNGLYLTGISGISGISGGSDISDLSIEKSFASVLGVHRGGEQLGSAASMRYGDLGSPIANRKYSPTQSPITTAREASNYIPNYSIFLNSITSLCLFLTKKLLHVKYSVFYLLKYSPGFKKVDSLVLGELQGERESDMEIRLQKYYKDGYPCDLYKSSFPFRQAQHHTPSILYIYIYIYTQEDLRQSF